MGAVNSGQPQRPDRPARVEQSDQPQYQLIANDLRARIQRRELPPGAQVPTEKELAGTYDCSRNTVRMALAALANEGLISAGRARAGRTVRRREQFVLAHRVEDELGSARLRGPVRTDPLLIAGPPGGRGRPTGPGSGSAGQVAAAAGRSAHP